MEWWEDYPMEKETADDAVNRCKNWISTWVTQRKTINHRYSSYTLKHFVEGMGIDCKYVPTEAFIQAAKEAGYKESGTGLNRVFNMSFVKYNNHLKSLLYEN